jgi:hypothetical protein
LGRRSGDQSGRAGGIPLARPFVDLLGLELVPVVGCARLDPMAEDGEVGGGEGRAAERHPAAGPAHVERGAGHFMVEAALVRAPGSIWFRSTWKLGAPTMSSYAPPSS